MAMMKLPKIFKRSSSGIENSTSPSPSPSSSFSALPALSPKRFWKSPSPSRSPPKKNTEISVASTSASIACSSSSASSSLIKAELEAVFRLFDANNDGKISVSEVGAVLKCLGEPPTEEELRKMIQEVDSDGDGFISLDEFLRFHHGHGASSMDAAELKATFAVFDLDSNGFISADELHRVLVGLGEVSVTMEDCGRMIRGVDCNGDGRVDFEEFKMMMTASA